MNNHKLTRRRFLVAVVALSGAAGGSIGAPILTASRTWAAGVAQAESGPRAELLRMARLLYPHDALPDATYAAALDQGMAAAEFGAALDRVMAALNAEAGGSWFDRDASAQVNALQAVQSHPAFLSVQNQVRSGVYNSAEFWRHVGYPGPSKGFGGYIRRGAGEIDWLPENGT